MAEKTGIFWCDSTYSHWHGCTKVAGALACEHCYAETVNKRGGHSNWGRGSPRRLISEHSRNEIHRWNRKAPEFFAQHGRKRRVFCSSMSDIFDNEVDKSWRDALYADLEASTELNILPLTKRIPNVPKMVPEHWKTAWPRHIGLMITAVTQKEMNRDVPRLVSMKSEFNIPWVGVSYEPAMERIDWDYPKEIWPEGPPMCCDGRECGCYGQPTEPPLIYGLDWIIYGGESGSGWRTFDGFFDAARATRDACASWNVAFLMKQAAAFQPKDHMIPEDLLIRQFPPALM